jgi:tetratricopeptide (TPR) repeat protein
MIRTPLGVLMSFLPRWRWLLATLVQVTTVVLAPPVLAQPLAPNKAPAETPVAVNSNLDAPLFYQLLIGEMELRSGEAGTAFEVILDAARRTRDEALFKRAVDVALQARAGEQALVASRAWRAALPESLDALRLQLQILLAVNRSSDINESLRSLLKLTPDAERASLITALPRFLQRHSDPKQLATAIDDALKPYNSAASTRVAARVASGRAWLSAGDADRALSLVQEAQMLEPAAPGPALLALDLMALRPTAERIVTQHLAQPSGEDAVRQAYVRTLTLAQRYADAVQQLRISTGLAPQVAAPYLTLGALQLELKHPQDAETALLRYVELAQAQAALPTASPATSNTATTDDDDDDSPPRRGDQGLVQAWLLLAQAAEQRGDFKAAESWLARVEDPQRALEVQTRRATILARQGQINPARELIRRTPERTAEDGRAKLVAEASVLREVKRWPEAFEVLGNANQRFPDDADLLYEQAMMAEKLQRLDEMERLLRRAIEVKPDSPHAHNALGYSLADRSLRLPEARSLIQRALALAPGDPFITDSLGWAEFRSGNLEEALRLLRQAYAARPDTEIGAHLGEVLWAAGQRDEAKRIWREVGTRDKANEVLRETLARLRIDL